MGVAPTKHRRRRHFLSGMNFMKLRSQEFRFSCEILIDIEFDVTKNY